MKISRLALGAAAAAVGMQLAAFAGDLPKGGSVVHGDVSVATETAQVTLDQVSDRAIVNWESFDIGEGCGVRVNQPAMSSAMLSRVVGDDASDILGSLDADGHFYLVNPNGIVFGENASVNVHALTASTLDTTDASFLSGNPVFSGSGGEVHNLGTLTAEVVTLIGSTVRNYGEIDAETHVGLHARSGIPPPLGTGTITLDFTEADVPDFAAANPEAGLVEQYGAIHAPQGRLEVNGGDIVVGGDANVKDLVIEADGSAIFTADTSDDLDRFRMLAGGLATVAAPVDVTSASVRGNDVITVATMDIEKHLVLDAENQAVISASVT